MEEYLIKMDEEIKQCGNSADNQKNTFTQQDKN